MINNKINKRKQKENEIKKIKIKIKIKKILKIKSNQIINKI